MGCPQALSFGEMEGRVEGTTMLLGQFDLMVAQVKLDAGDCKEMAL